MTTSSATTTNPSTSVSTPFTVHSTFRNEVGNQVLPHGLDWHVEGESHVAYTTSRDNAAFHLKQADTPQGRQGIVEAHNRWCFAKDLPFRKVDDIHKLKFTTTGEHVRVQWKEYQETGETERYTIQDVAKIVAADKAALGEGPPAAVWINGYLYGDLTPKSVPTILKAIEDTPSNRLIFFKVNNIIRIERRFVGMIRGQDVFDHLLDNLYALEDPQIIDDRTLIGTATLPDWIMGGELTSRLWIRELENGNILCLRPLYNDDINTKDRKYELVKGKDTERIRLVKMELERLRYLAALPSPVDETLLTQHGSPTDEDSKKEEKKEPPTEREINQRKSRRRFFGL